MNSHSIRPIHALMLSATLLLRAASAADIEPGFTSLFNGEDLKNWDGVSELWSVQDGAITGQTSKDHPAKSNTFLVWQGGTVADFELRLSFKLTPGSSEGFANSGVQYRSKIAEPAYRVVGGYQADMEAGATYTGILYEERGRGILAQRGQMVQIEADGHLRVLGTLAASDEIQAGIKKGDWNDYIIIARGNHLTHIINGKVTIDVTDDQVEKRAAAGILALQLHAGPPMKAQFKNIRIKNL